MKTKIYKGGILIFVITVLLFSCSKDFLDTTPNGVTTVNNFYKTDAEINQGVLAVYDILQLLNASSDWNSLWTVKALLSDEVSACGGGYNDQAKYHDINGFVFGPSNAAIAWIFKYSYYGIYRANTLIDAVPSPDSDIKKAAVGEAKTLRALIYFDLVTLWGKVPLVIHPLNPSDYNQPRAELADVWAQIEKDLTDAIALLPNKAKQATLGIDKAHVSKGFAQALLGKAYLYQNKYVQAATQLQAVITTGEYSLGADYSRILRKDTEFGNESLFEVSYNGKGWGWGNFNWGVPRMQENNIQWQLCGPRTWGDPTKMTGPLAGLIGGWGFCQPRSELFKAYVNAGDSIRKQASVAGEAEIKAAGGTLRDADGNLSYGTYGVVRLKYGTWSDETTGPQPEVNYGTNLRVMRYADVLLMAAEALNKQPSADDVTALIYINQVRTRVSLPTLSLSGATLFNAIKNERRLELAFEGIRFQDLIRWGDAQTALENQGKLIPKGNGTNESYPQAGFKEKNKLLPIPEDEIKVNPKALPNNPGY